MENKTKNEIMKELKNTDFFFCYTKVVSIYLKQNGINYIVKAKSVKNGDTFTVFAKTKELEEALNNYKYWDNPIRSNN